jgi:hypothetical protein
MAKSAIGLPQTKGFFQVRGIVTGTSKDKFYKETLTKTEKKPFRMVNFGIKTTEDSTTYLSLSGQERDKVYFSKTETVDGKKVTDTTDVAWKDRFKFKKEGYKMLGVNLGVSKTKDEKGNDVNDKKVMVEYDACKEISDNLTDGKSVFVKGNIDYSSFVDNGATKRSIKFVPTQVSLCKDIDFNAEDYKPQSDFTQVIVFTEIRKDENADRFVLEAKIVNYNSIEVAEFFIEDKALANAIRKNLKPYNALKVWGNMVTIVETSQVESKDVWGQTNAMDRADNPVRRELVIVGADPTSVDTDTYSEKAIAEAISKINSNKKAESEFGGGDSWGSVGNTTSENDDESAW